MIVAFTVLLVVNLCTVLLVWLGWRRIAAHVRGNPEAMRALIDHILTPLLLGGPLAEAQKPPPQSDPKPEAKKAKGTLI